MPYRVFDPDQQRVTHAAITENKRLSAVLEALKEMQEAQAPQVSTVGKQRTRYQPTGKRSPGPRSFLDKRAARKADETARGTGPGSDP